MKPVKTSDSNGWAGVDQKGVYPVPITRWHDGDYEVVSIAFEPSEEDIQAMIGGKVLVLDLVGGLMPPLRLRVGE